MLNNIILSDDMLSLWWVSLCWLLEWNAACYYEDKLYSVILYADLHHFEWRYAVIMVSVIMLIVRAPQFLPKQKDDKEKNQTIKS
jgi:hypothetical protein